MYPRNTCLKWAHSPGICRQKVEQKQPAGHYRWAWRFWRDQNPLNQRLHPALTSHWLADPAISWHRQNETDTSGCPGVGNCWGRLIPVPPSVSVWALQRRPPGSLHVTHQSLAGGSPSSLEWHCGNGCHVLWPLAGKEMVSGKMKMMKMALSC